MASRPITVAIAIAFIACVHAVPTPNDIVPETKDDRGFDVAPSNFDSAKQIVTEMLQEGGDWGACGELANTTREEVTDGVKDKQDMLDSLDKGCGCRALGQDGVNVTFTRMTSAQTSVTQAEFSLNAATTSQVHLASQTYQTLRSGECGWIKQDQSYVSALATHTTAVNTLASVKTLYESSVEMYTSAVNEAARLVLECECRIQSEQEQTWVDANEDNDADEAAWAQAHHIDCVVQSIAEADCAFSPVPSLTRPTVCDNIESVSCNDPSGSGSDTSASETYK